MVSPSDYDYLIVGCGLSGAVVAERIASQLGKRVLIVEKRDHIAGNCYDYVDGETGIRMNRYGAHLFHTGDEGVWSYVQRFAEWKRWDHEVKASVNGCLVPLPVNISTVNTLFNTSIANRSEMQQWLTEHQEVHKSIDNSEQMAKSRIGSELYSLLVKNYTHKQWDKYPDELDPTVLARIPVYDDFDTRYFKDKYQALPANGYTDFVQSILSHPLISVELNCDFFTMDRSTFNDVKIIYTGPVDRYFSSAGLDKLEYRSIEFQIEKYFNMSYYQPNSVVNYPGMEVPFTRIVEYKHFLHQVSPHTVVVKETTNDHGDPYYPIPNDRNKRLYEKYRLLAETEERLGKAYFVGRLANYKYFNMDAAIRNALDFFEEKINTNDKVNGEV